MIAMASALISRNGILFALIAAGLYRIVTQPYGSARVREGKVIERANTETATAIVKKSGRAAQPGAADPATPGVLDPYVRNGDD